MTVDGIPGAMAGSTAEGSIKADANGVALGAFVVPPNVPCGTKEVTIKNMSNAASTSYTANGVHRTIRTTVLTERITAMAYDPVAQAFQFDDDRILTSVGVYFSAVDPVNNVTVQIRNMVNGYPGQTIYGEKLLTTADIKLTGRSNLGNDALSETKVTFPNPIMCAGGTQYCIVLVTASNVSAVYAAEMGQTDFVSKQTVAVNPYLAGTMFSSSNAITWTAHQTTRLKFKVYHAEFQPTGAIEFAPMTNLGVDKLVLFADYLTPQNTGCTWQVKVNNGDWQPLSNYVDIDLTDVATAVSLRATFAASKYMSPLLATDSWTLVGFLTGVTGRYVSRAFTLSQNFTTISQTIDAFMPSNCTVVPRFSIDGGTTWLTGTLQSQSQVSTTFTRMSYQYVFDTPQNASTASIRVAVDITSPNQIAKPAATRFLNVII